jgi:hypothetical protein
MEVPRIDRRELEALRVAIHEPQLVAHVLDGVLFNDPHARRAFDALAGADTFHVALERVDGPTQAIIERLAVEEPDLGEEPKVYVAELTANLVESAGSRRVRDLAAAGDDATIAGKLLVDALVRARDTGDWDAAETCAQQLLAWLIEQSKGTG